MENAQHHLETRSADTQMEKHHEIADGAAPGKHRKHSKLMQIGDPLHH